MNKKLHRVLSLTMLSLFTFSCSNVSVNNLSEQQVQTSSVKSSAVNFKLVKPQNIPADIIKTTYEKSKEMSDKESKRRGIPLFNLPKNPIGLEISSGTNKLGYILNYIGTPADTEDVNVEIKVLHSETSNAYSLNYSGPLTNSRKYTVNKNDFKPLNKISKNEGLSFELIMGLPPEHVVNTFEEYLDDLGNQLKRFYQPEKVDISSDDVFIYAVHYNGEVIGFFFESHANKVILGERKYADMQIGVMISNEGKVEGNYSLVEFNPKVKLNKEPVYKYKNQGDVNLVELGEL